ncbi:hypothetical protein, partial [Xanthomonas translucens]
MPLRNGIIDKRTDSTRLRPLHIAGCWQQGGHAPAQFCRARSAGRRADSPAAPLRRHRTVGIVQGVVD